MDFESFIPLRDQVLVKFDKPDEWHGRIIIPPSARQGTCRGQVVAIGPEQHSVKIGETIVFSRYAGVPLVEREHHYECAVLANSEILAVDRDEAELRKRTMVRVTEEKIRELCSETGDIIFAYFNKRTNSLYVTFEEEDEGL